MEYFYGSFMVFSVPFDCNELHSLILMLLGHQTKLFALRIDRSVRFKLSHAKWILMDKLLCFYYESMLSEGWVGWFSC